MTNRKLQQGGSRTGGAWRLLCHTLSVFYPCLMSPCICQKQKTITTVLSGGCGANCRWLLTTGVQYLFLGDSRARLVHSDRAHSTLVAQHLYQGFFLVGRPQGDCAVRVAEVDDGVMRVVAHHVQTASLGADGCYLFPHRHIEVLQETCGTLKYGCNNRLNVKMSLTVDSDTSKSRNHSGNLSNTILHHSSRTHRCG